MHLVCCVSRVMFVGGSLCPRAVGRGGIGGSVLSACAIRRGSEAVISLEGRECASPVFFIGRIFVVKMAEDEDEYDPAFPTGDDDEEITVEIENVPKLCCDEVPLIVSDEVVVDATPISMKIEEVSLEQDLMNSQPIIVIAQEQIVQNEVVDEIIAADLSSEIVHESCVEMNDVTIDADGSSSQDVIAEEVLVTTEEEPASREEEKILPMGDPPLSLDCTSDSNCSSETWKTGMPNGEMCASPSPKDEEDSNSYSSPSKKSPPSVAPVKVKRSRGRPAGSTKTQLANSGGGGNNSTEGQEEEKNGKGQTRRRSSRIKSIEERKERQREIKEIEVKKKCEREDKLKLEMKMADPLRKDEERKETSTPNSAAEDGVFQPPCAPANGSTSPRVGKESPATGSAEEIFSRPEKVKSRWRRSSELERAETKTYPMSLSGLPNGFVNSGPDMSVCDMDKLRINSSTVKIDENEKDDDKVKAPVTPDKMPAFDEITSNIYRCDRKKSKSKKEVRRMVCDCTMMKEEIARGMVACGDDCLNRLLMIECGSRCQTGDFCSNKRFQQQIYAKIEPFKTEMKGWGLRALEDLPGGSFLIEYVGEVLESREFRKRVKEYARDNHQHYYFMALKSDEIIDATRMGNPSRFINHSCSPNCETQKWTVNGELRIGFFTRTFVAAGEELTFDYQFQRYGYEKTVLIRFLLLIFVLIGVCHVLNYSKEAQRCYCQSDMCRGFIGGSNNKQMPIKKEKQQREQIPRRKKIYEERRKESLEDMALEEEVERLNRKGGLKNREHTLTLSRLMVRAEDPELRMALLKILQRAPFVENYRASLSEAVPGLPRTVAAVELDGGREQRRGGGRVEDADSADVADPPHQQQDHSDGQQGPFRRPEVGRAERRSTRGEGGERDERFHDDERRHDYQRGDDCERDDHGGGRCDDSERAGTGAEEEEEEETLKEAVVQMEVDEVKREEISDSEKEKEESEIKPNDDLKLIEESCEVIMAVEEVKMEIDEVPVRVPEEVKAVEEVKTEPVGEIKIEEVVVEEVKAEEMIVDEEKVAEETVAVKKEVVEDPIVVATSPQRALLLANLASELLDAWSSLKEAYRIPKREQNQTRREHEREADRRSKERETDRDRDDDDRDYDRYDRRRSPDKDHYRHREKRGYHDSDPPSEHKFKKRIRSVVMLSPGYSPMSRISKEERRHLFELKVQQEEAEEAMRKQHEEYMRQQQEAADAEAAAVLEAEAIAALSADPMLGMYYNQDYPPPPEFFTTPAPTIVYGPPPPAPTPMPVAPPVNCEPPVPGEEDLPPPVDENGLPIEQPIAYPPPGVVYPPPPQPQPVYSPVDVQPEVLVPIHQPFLGPEAQLPPMFYQIGPPGEELDSPGRPPTTIIQIPLTDEVHAEGRVYYYHTKLRQPQWEPPPLEDEDESEGGGDTPTIDEPKVVKKRSTTTAAADTSSENAKRLKESFRSKMSLFMVQCLNPYQKRDCKLGRITSKDDFKHLARKLTHFVLAKELKHCRKIEELEISDNVKHKAKDFVRKYMGKFGPIYRKNASPKDDGV
uniref:[histone H3]-lysine(36) N-trimethyltransferase n=1 Tax=Strigamia maritima TaxID=126957 RepID=T1IP88_STRMM